MPVLAMNRRGRFVRMFVCVIDSHSAGLKYSAISRILVFPAGSLSNSSSMYLLDMMLPPE